MALGHFKINMAYRVEDTDIVIDGWDQGVSNNPYKGINDMRGVNIVSIPGEISVSFAQTNKTFGNVTGNVTSADPTSDVVTATITAGSINDINGTAVVFTGASLPTGITAGTVYYLDKVSSNTFTLSVNPDLSDTVNITATGTGTFASVNIGEITYFEKVTGFALDKNGRCWFVNTNGFYQYTKNPVSGTTGLSSTAGNGLIWYKGYLFVFYNASICYMAYTLTTVPSGTWVTEWDPVTGTSSPGTYPFNTGTATANPHEAIVGKNDDTVYITDANFIASLFEKPTKTFNPADTTTYTWAKQAQPLPTNETARCLEELGRYLLIGGDYNVVYPWNRVDTNFNNVILIAENGITHMITVNTNTYIFAGKRGRIYVTNGSQAQQYLKIPDHISGIEPIFTWQGVGYNKNQLYFGVSATNNAGSAITSYNGLWAVDITTNALRVPTLQSTTTGTVTAVYAYTGAVSGYGLAVAWKTASTNGIDTSSSTPYNTYVAYIDTDIIPIGTYLGKRTLNNIEFKLSAPLANGEGIKISQRSTLSGSYTQIGETLGTASYNPMSDFYTVNFDLGQWLQLRIEAKSTVIGGVTPSFVRLYEIRLR